MAVHIRDATPDDIPAITAIYAVEVRELVNTYEYEVPDEAEMLRRMQAITGQGFPYIVAEVDGQLAGYAYASSYRTRIAYQWTVENSVYVDARFQGKGVGSALMQALIDACTATRLPADGGGDRRALQHRFDQAARALRLPPGRCVQGPGPQARPLAGHGADAARARRGCRQRSNQ
jgi:Sortase and related acyltransferases